nr:dystrophin-like [Microcebus murinus]
MARLLSQWRAELVEQRSHGEGNSEHLLTQHYCQSLYQDSPMNKPHNPAQILISLHSEEGKELESILADPEEENRCWL